jgi:hypothetical protein
LWSGSVVITTSNDHIPEPGPAGHRGLLADLVAAGRLGVKSGSGLRGDYPPERRDALAALRDRVLHAISTTVTRNEAPDGSE